MGRAPRLLVVVALALAIVALVAAISERRDAPDDLDGCIDPTGDDVVVTPGWQWRCREAQP